MELFDFLCNDQQSFGYDWNWESEYESNTNYDKFSFSRPCKEIGLGMDYLNTLIPEDYEDGEDDTAPFETDRPLEWFERPVSGSGELPGYVLSALGESTVNGPQVIEEDVDFDKMAWVADWATELGLPDKIMTAKTWFDGCNLRHFSHVRSECNPYEAIGKSIFISRAGVKLREIDVHANLIENVATTAGRSRLYFGDLCAAPGGFTEYLLWVTSFRPSTSMLCFSMSLQPLPDDKSTPAFDAGLTFRTGPQGRGPQGGPRGRPRETVAQAGRNKCMFVQVKGVEEPSVRAGDITDKRNMTNYLAYCADALAANGIHAGRPGALDLIVADGGDDVSENYNEQELIMRLLILSETITALTALAKGGSFVIKLFDCFSPFSVELIWILTHCFTKSAIYKPLTSRPANSERYFIGSGYLLGQPEAQPLLSYLNLVAEKIKTGKRTVMKENRKIVNRLLGNATIMNDDTAFRDYIYRSNTFLGHQQLRHLRIIQHALAEYEGGGQHLAPRNHREVVSEVMRRAVRLPSPASIVPARGCLWSKDSLGAQGRPLLN